MVVVYQVIKGPGTAIAPDGAPMVAENREAERALSAIEPAAGPAKRQETGGS